jgi:hypothetical protein
MKLLILVLVSCLAITTMGCSTLSVTHDYDTQVDFAPLKTFGWMAQPSRVSTKMGLYDKRIKDAVNSQLSAKGYETKSSNPDFLIAYHVGVSNKIDVQDWGYNYGPRGYASGRDISVYQYTQGTLILDIVDPKTKQLIWRGVAQDAVDRGASTEKKEKKLNEAVSKILEKFPPLAQTS